MSVIARDGYFPKILSFSKKNIPIYSITTMSLFAFLLILAGNLEVILEFGSITFLIVSLLMGFANHKIRKETNANPLITISSIISLASATFLIIYYNFSTQIKHLYFSLFIYIILTFFAYLFSRKPVKR